MELRRGILNFKNYCKIEAGFASGMSRKRFDNFYFENIGEKA